MRVCVAIVLVVCIYLSLSGSNNIGKDVIFRRWKNVCIMGNTM